MIVQRLEFGSLVDRTSTGDKADSSRTVNILRTFGYVRAGTALDPKGPTPSDPERYDFFSILENKIALGRRFGAGEQDGWRWEPTCSGEGLQFRFPEEIGDCLNEVVRLQSGIYLIVRSLEARQPFTLYTGEQRGLYFMFVAKGAVKMSVSGHGDALLVGPAGINVLYPAKAVLEGTVMPGMPLQLVTVALREAELLHEFGIPSTWFPDRLMEWLSLPTQSLGFTLTLPSRELIAAARDIQDCQFSGAMRSLYYAGKARELVCHMIASRVLATSFDTARDFHHMSRHQLCVTARMLIEADVARAWTIESLAKNLAVSPNKLMRDFKAEYGQTVQEFRREMRLTRARELLLHTSLSITDVALAVGYERVNNFSDAFKAHFGTPPSAVRRPER